MSAEERLCPAIWNGCVCGRAPHDDDRHVWLNTLDNRRAVDPAQYPSVPTEPGARREAIDGAIREWWNDTMRKSWQDDLADSDLRYKSLAELGNIIERTLRVSVPTEPGAPDREWVIREAIRRYRLPNMDDEQVASLVIGALRGHGR